jgi:hypothetical protein
MTVKPMLKRWSQKFKQSGRLPIVETGRAGHLALNEVGGRVMWPVSSAAVPSALGKAGMGAGAARRLEEGGPIMAPPSPPARSSRC